MRDDTRTSSACDSCPARCCSQKFGYQSIHLTHEERVNPLFKPHLTDFGQLKLEGRHCRFLDTATFRCSIYEQRPHACRGFVCHDMENQGDNTLAMVYRDRKLRAHLDSLGLLPPLKEDLFWSENSRRVPTPTRTYSDMDRIQQFEPGTRRFFRLDAATGEIVLEGRRRSTKVPWQRSKYRSGSDLIAQAALPIDEVQFTERDITNIHEAIAQHQHTSDDDKIAAETCAACAQ